MDFLTFALTAGGDTATVSTVTTALSTALESAGSSLLGVISAVIPVVVPVAIGVTAVGLGLRIFRKIAGR